MVVETIHSHMQRDGAIRPSIDHPEIVDALRHGNIYDVLKTSGVNRKDIEEYLAGQSRLFQNQIAQDYQIFSSEGTLPSPNIETDFANHRPQMLIDQHERQLFTQEMQMLSNRTPEVAWNKEGNGLPRVKLRAAVLGESTSKIRAGSTETGGDIRDIAEEAIKESESFFTDLTLRVIDAQMVQEMKSKTEELNRDIQRMVALVMSGQADPEFVLVAAAKSNLQQNGTYFSWRGRRVMHMNQQMNRISESLFRMDPGDAGYYKAQQMAQAKTRDMSLGMQFEMQSLQTHAQNIAGTLEFASNAIRSFRDMRQTTIQAIAARSG